MATTTTHVTSEKTAFQVVVVIEPEPNTDDSLGAFADAGLAALINEAPALALGPVAAVDLDERVVKFEMTVEAVAASEIHQMIGLILSALERGTDGVLIGTHTSRSRDRELVCA